MFQESELIALFISLCVIILGFIYNRYLKEVPHYRMLICAFLTYTLSLIATVVESLILFHFFNIFEHITFLLSAAILFVWYSMFIISGKGNK